MTTLEMTPILSSMIESYAYANGNLILRFKNAKPGMAYRYLAVPQNEVDALLKAPSFGAHFAANIKPNYACEKVILP